MPLYTPLDWERCAALENQQREYRTEFRRDYDRILHAPAFRRLQGKTQVFPHNQDDFFRTRLTHTLEVAQIATSIGIRLNATHAFFADSGNQIDIDLLNAVSLAHDIGHPPFGHNGEVALNDSMRPHGGFEGNAQSLRIIGRIARRDDTLNYTAPIADFPVRKSRDTRTGLNLTARTLAAILKYDQKIDYNVLDAAPFQKGYYDTEEDLVEWIKSCVPGGAQAAPGRFRTIECSIMDLADDIAYSTLILKMRSWDVSLIR